MSAVFSMLPVRSPPARSVGAVQFMPRSLVPRGAMLTGSIVAAFLAHALASPAALGGVEAELVLLLRGMPLIKASICPGGRGAGPVALRAAGVAGRSDGLRGGHLGSRRSHGADLVPQLHRRRRRALSSRHARAAGARVARRPRWRRRAWPEVTLPKNRQRRAHAVPRRWSRRSRPSSTSTPRLSKRSRGTLVAAFVRCFPAAWGRSSAVKCSGPQA